MSKQQSKKIKLGIIGAGNRGIDCFGAFLEKQDDSCVAALCDPNPVRMKVASKIFACAPNFYHSVEDMMACESLDAVIVTSPDYCHVGNALTALTKGVPVLIDKPLAPTVSGCREILAAAKKNQTSVMIGFNLRHDPTLIRLKQIIDDGVLGRIFLIENREFYDDGKTYMSRWNRKYELSGGLWVHKGSHDFDVFNWLLNFPRPVKVSAIAGVSVLNAENIPFEPEQGKPVGPSCSICAYSERCPDCYEYIQGREEWGEAAIQMDGYTKDLCIYLSDKDTHDNGIAIVEYENGVRASHMECFVTSVTDRCYTVVGDRAQAEVSLHNRTITIRPRWSKEVVRYEIPKVEGGHGGADSGLIRVFLDVVRGNSINMATAEHGLLSTAIGQAAELSVREERVVFMNEFDHKVSV